VLSKIAEGSSGPSVVREGGVEEFERCLTRKPHLDELMFMNNRKVSPYSGTTVMLTAEGRLALAIDALAAARKCPTEARRKRLLERAIIYLRPVVQG